MATTALLLVHLSDSPRFGVWLWWCGVLCRLGFWSEPAPDGKTVAGPVPMACVACGRRGRRWVAWGVVLGCGYCAVVGVFMA